MRKIESLVAVSVDATDLENATGDYERQVSRAVQSDPEVQAFVERLEEAAGQDTTTLGPGDLPSGDAIAVGVPALPQAAGPRALAPMAGGERDLAVLLATLEPELHPGLFVFALAPDGCRAARRRPCRDDARGGGSDARPALEDADRLGLEHAGAMQWITLRVHSALDAVGLTAAFSTALGVAGLSANVIAGLHHDHVFVSAGRGQQALAVLRALSAAGADG